MGDDFLNSEGVRIEQDDFDSLIGRMGVRAGFNFPKDKGLVYARASVLHDFKGESEAVASLGAKSVRMSDDIGGTWGEFGVGANFRLTPDTYTYVDLERTTGGEVVRTALERRREARLLMTWAVYDCLNEKSRPRIPVDRGLSIWFP